MDAELGDQVEFQLSSCRELLRIKRDEIAASQLALDAYRLQHSKCMRRHEVLKGVGSAMPCTTEGWLGRGTQSIVDQENTLNAQCAEVVNLEASERRLMSV